MKTGYSDKIINKLLEIYRSRQYRTTVSGRKIQWDEPGEDETPEVRMHNAWLTKKAQQKREAKERLKQKGRVPTRQGTPIFENGQVIDESYQQVMTTFRRLYQSNRGLRFRDWIKQVADLLDDLD